MKKLIAGILAATIASGAVAAEYTINGLDGGRNGDHYWINGYSFDKNPSSNIFSPSKYYTTYTAKSGNYYRLVIDAGSDDHVLFFGVQRPGDTKWNRLSGNSKNRRNVVFVEDFSHDMADEAVKYFASIAETILQDDNNYPDKWDFWEATDDGNVRYLPSNHLLLDKKVNSAGRSAFVYSSDYYYGKDEKYAKRFLQDIAWKAGNLKGTS